jgi:hypothetical protein
LPWRNSATSRAFFSSASTTTSSPARGTSDRPWISTGIDGPALCTGLPFSSSIARTRPYTAPATTTSPRFSVPDCTSSVATGPRPLSRRASITTPLGRRVHLRLQFEHFGLQQDLLEQRVDALPRLGRHRHHRRFAAEVLGHHAVLQQVLLHALGIRFVLVDLVDGDHQRHFRRLRVRDGLDGLRHGAVIGGHHQYDDVGHLRAARAHGSECLMARGI